LWWFEGARVDEPLVEHHYASLLLIVHVLFTVFRRLPVLFFDFNSFDIAPSTMSLLSVA
jgi:xylose isomerase